MTAFGDDETKERAVRLGALLVDKPFKMDVLRLVVRGLLANGKNDQRASAREGNGNGRGEGS
jgi:DNA-binding response OmpR family regulator